MFSFFLQNGLCLVFLGTCLHKPHPAPGHTGTMQTRERADTTPYSGGSGEVLFLRVLNRCKKKKKKSAWFALYEFLDRIRFNVKRIMIFLMPSLKQVHHYAGSQPPAPAPGCLRRSLPVCRSLQQLPALHLSTQAWQAAPSTTAYFSQLKKATLPPLREMDPALELHNVLLEADTSINRRNSGF